MLGFIFDPVPAHEVTNRNNNKTKIDLIFINYFKTKILKFSL